MFGTKIPSVHLPDCGLDWRSGGFFQQGHDRDQCEDAISLHNYGHFGIFFGVFDGHGGKEVSSHLANFFHQRFFGLLDDSREPEKTALPALIGAHFEMVEETADHFCGSCSVAGFLMSNRTLAWVNLGDCRILTAGVGGYRRLTRDHNFLDMEEVSRVQALGGDIGCNRLCIDDGSLNLSRAYGDKKFSPYLSKEPTSGLYRLLDTDQAIIAFSDGVSCRLSDAEVARLALHGPDPEQQAKAIAHRAVREGSPDDISCIVIRF